MPSYGLVASNGKKLDAAFAGFATLEDASLLVTRLRVVKSPEEMAYVRKEGRSPTRPTRPRSR